MTKKIAIVLIAILMLGSFSVLASEPNKATESESEDIVAVVNGEEITGTRLDQEINLQSFLMQLYQSNQEFMQLLLNSESGQKLLNEYRKKKLDQYIVQVLLMQEAQNRGLTVTEEVKDKFAQSRMNQVMKSNNLNKEQLKAALKQQGIESLDQYKKVLVEQGKDYLLIQVLQDKVLENVQVTDEEVKNYYEENKDKFNQKAAAHLRHILAESKEEAEKIKDKLANGEDFAKVAKELSKGPNAKNGGDLGFIEKGRMRPNLNDPAFNLEVGQVSDIIDSEMGFHILKVVERRPAGVVPLEEVKKEIVNKLKSQKKQDAWNNLIEQLKANAEIDIKL